MATLHIRNVPEALYQRLQNLAAQEHRSLNAQVISLLSRSVEEGSSKSSVTELLQRAQQIRESFPKVSDIPESIELLREGREERAR